MRYCKISSLVSSCLLLLFFSFTGCAGEKEEAVTLSFLDTEDKSGAWAEVIASFEADNPGIKVNLIEGPASTDARESQYAASLLAGDSTYDLIYLDVIWVPKFSAKGWLVPLDEQFPPEEQEKFLPGDIEASTCAGHIWCIPIRSNGGMLYYRRDLLEAAGRKPPETFDELVAVSAELQSPPDVRGFRPQDVRYSEPGIKFSGEILAVEMLGPQTVVLANTAEGEMRALVQEDKPSKSAPASFFVPEDNIHLFSHPGGEAC